MREPHITFFANVSASFVIQASSHFFHHGYLLPFFGQPSGKSVPVFIHPGIQIFWRDCHLTEKHWLRNNPESQCLQRNMLSAVFPFLFLLLNQTAITPSRRSLSCLNFVVCCCSYLRVHRCGFFTVIL